MKILLLTLAGLMTLPIIWFFWRLTIDILSDTSPEEEQVLERMRRDEEEKNHPADDSG